MARRLWLTASVVAAVMLAAPAQVADAAPTPAPAPTSPTATPTSRSTPTPTPTSKPSSAPSPTPSGVPTVPPPVGSALAIAPATAVPVLTMPAGDGFRDTARIRVLAAQAGTVDVDAVPRTKHSQATVIATAVPLRRVTTGWARTVVVPITGLSAGRWTIRVRRSDDPTAKALTTVVVGSGKPVSVIVTPASRTLYPLRDGVLDSAAAAVVATDETGTALPVRGTVRLTSGKHKRARAITAGTATVPVTGLPLGTASLTADVQGPAGKAVTRITALALAPTAVGALRLSASSDTVQPVADGLLDSVVLSTRGAASAGSPEPVSGTLTIANGKTVVQTWPVTSGAPAQFTWDGRVGGRIVPGTYLATLTLKGPEGLPRITTTTLRVSAQHLPWRVRDLFRVADGNQQGLAVHDGIFYVGFDNGDGTARIERYDGSGNAFPLTLNPLPIGHAAELSYSTTSNQLYAVNGGSGVPTKVWAIEPQAADGGSALRQTIDLAALGDCGMVAVDDANGRLLVFARKDGVYSISSLSIADAVDPATGAGKVLSTTPITIQGVPQGMEVVGQELWIYTSLKHSNHLSQYSLQNGLVADGDGFDVMNAGEGEGLAATTSSAGASIWVGMHGGNRIGVLEPVADEPAG